jgi:predicted NUDIX family NTP pyrophosphohydrolase
MAASHGARGNVRWNMGNSRERSAGILLYRITEQAVTEVFIGHMGGPFWAGRHAGGWSIPKGLIEPGEDELAGALREFEEEVGQEAPHVSYVLLGRFRYTSGKIVVVFAAQSDFAAGSAGGNTFTMEWPRGSGRLQEFPELDAVAWVPVEEAREKLVRGQVAVLDALEDILAGHSRSATADPPNAS